MKIGVLVSGTGTNLQALLDAQARGEIAPGEIAVVVSNRRGVPALGRAAAAGVPAEVVEHAGLAREAFETRLLAVLARHAVEAVVLAGFMRILTAHFLDRFPLRVVNTHPSLLPAFPGTDAPAQALAYGVKLAGVTVHFVDHGVDTGPIIAQAQVAVADDDDPRTLHARIQREEHRLLPIVVQRLAAGRLSCQGRLVRGCAE
ncbi:MAG TPA: phosphoribosylglycinamide formyltransferase [Kofleriaceae bacterium]|jgi:phosphoribosylglycinamide formyltransferase-1|nr:phosphoribosylglycinamide formyltransferase [Kofleriaceae bacterium]